MDNKKIVNSTRPQDDDPKFGAGSVFGKDAKEEARLKKLGINRKAYDPEAQPWLMRVGGKGGKKYKGIREVEYPRIPPSTCLLRARMDLSKPILLKIGIISLPS